VSPPSLYVRSNSSSSSRPSSSNVVVVVANLFACLFVCQVLQIFDYFFTAVFTVEIVVKVRCYC